MSPLPPLRMIAAAGALAALAALWWALHAERAAHAHTRQAWAEQAAQAVEQRADGEREQRRISERRAGLAQEISDADRHADARNRAVADALRADRDRLRDELAEYVRGASAPGRDPAATCDERAAALGVALGEALRAEEDITAAAEQCLVTAHSLRRWAEGLSDAP